METLLVTYYQATAILLLLIGFYLLIVNPNLIKKVLGINIMETAVFLFLVSLGKLEGAGKAPILLENVGMEEYINPMPQHLVIVGILITLGVTSFALILIIKIFTHYGTMNSNKLRRMV